MSNLPIAAKPTTSRPPRLVPCPGCGILVRLRTTCWRCGTDSPRRVR